MKRMITAAVVASLLLLSACSMPQSTAAESENGKVQGQTGTTKMPNPFENYDSLEEAEEAAGVSIVAPEVIEESSSRVYRAIPGELLEVIYYDESEDEVARIRKAQGTERIDGDYSEYNAATDIDAEKYAAELLGKGEKVNVITIRTQENGTDFVTSVTFRGIGMPQSDAMHLIDELAGAAGQAAEDDSDQS